MARFAHSSTRSSARRRISWIADVLAEWRSAERRLVELSPESEESRRVAADVELLRDQYQQLFHRTLGGSA